MRKLLPYLVWAIIVLNTALSMVLISRIAETGSPAPTRGAARDDAMSSMLALAELSPEERRLARSILRSRIADHDQAALAVSEANRDVIAAFAKRPFDPEAATIAAERLLAARAELSRQATGTYMQVFAALPPAAQDKLVEHARKRRSLLFPSADEP